MMGNGNCLETFSTQAYQQNSQYIKSDMKKLKGKLTTSLQRLYY